jgi:hypothetical protein
MSAEATMLSQYSPLDHQLKLYHQIILLLEVPLNQPIEFQELFYHIKLMELESQKPAFS